MAKPGRAPVSGRVVVMRHVDGTLYPVNSIGLAHVPQLFATNERVVVIQETESFGVVATILVGAIGVGRISLAFDDLRTNTGTRPRSEHYGSDGPMLERGDELGAFHLGSTVILLVAPSVRLEPTKRLEERARMGEALFVRGGA